MEGTVIVTGTADADADAHGDADRHADADRHGDARPPTPPAGALRTTAHDSRREQLVPGRLADEPERQQRHGPVGERVTFDFPTGNGTSVHNVTFPTGPSPTTARRPRPRRRSSSLDPNNAPPMPDFVQPAGWEGYCKFDAPGTYTFVCTRIRR